MVQNFPFDPRLNTATINQPNTSTIKIAITLNTAWNIYNFRRPLIRSLRGEGYKVICFAPADESVPDLAQEGIEVHPLKHLSRKGTNPLQDTRLIRELTKAYRMHDIDLAIHFTIKPNIYGCIAAHRAGIRSIAVVTGLGYTFLSRSLASQMAKRLYRYAFRKNHLTIFQNPDDRTLFTKLKLVSEQRSAVILGSGIDTDLFTQEVPVPVTPSFVFIGRLLQDKGIRELLEGFTHFTEKYPEGKLIIVGQPDPHNPASVTEDELLKYRQNTSITFAGFHSDVRPFIRDATAVVLPSYREGVPRTLLEALSMGRPVITTDVPGCREVVVPGENGILIPSHDVRSMAEAFEIYFRKGEIEKQQMGAKSRKLAEKLFSTKVINMQYLEWVEKISACK